MKIFRASVKIYLSQFMITIITLLLSVGMFSTVQKHPYMFSAITTAIYLIAMYNISWNVGRIDSRKIPGFFPDKKTPLKLACITAVLPVAMLMIRILAPDIWRINIPLMSGEYALLIPGCVVEGTPDLIYRLWYFAFAAFVPSGNMLAYAAELIVLPVMIFIGYFVGLKRFSLFEYVYAKIVFSDKNSSRKESKARR